jgi:hypothetical protein
MQTGGFSLAMSPLYQVHEVTSVIHERLQMESVVAWTRIDARLE